MTSIRNYNALIIINVLIIMIVRDVGAIEEINTPHISLSGAGVM